MARPRGGSYTEKNSIPVAFRLPIELAERAFDAAGGREHLAEWARALVAEALDGKAGPGALQTQGYREGKRQGWAAGNAALRAALKAAYETLK